MAGYKGVGVVYVRQLVRASSPDVQLAVSKALSDEQRRMYQSCVASEWVPIELATAVSSAAAPLLFGHVEDPIRHLGKETGKHNLSGVHAFLVRFLTVPFLIQQTARLWRTYHEIGSAVSTRVGDNHVRVDVTGYPGLPEPFRVHTAGFMQGAVEMTGATNVRCVVGGDDARWTFDITWT
jgi:hypothetical protein